MADKKALIERKRVLETQPLTKWISVIETDGSTTQKKKHLVRFKQTPDLDHLKTDLTQSLKPNGGPVRYIFTPAGGTEVKSLNDLVKDKEYVAGYQGFKKLSGLLHKEKLAKGKKGKKNSTASNASNASSKASTVTGRLTLMQRQDLIGKSEPFLFLTQFHIVSFFVQLNKLKLRLMGKSWNCPIPNPVKLEAKLTHTV